MFFFVKTVNPRPSFHEDMTPAERELMTAHVGYVTELARQGVAIVFGPVDDPSGRYGIGVYEAESEEELRRLLIDSDPAAGLLRPEITPMAAAVVGHRVT